MIRAVFQPYGTYGQPDGLVDIDLDFYSAIDYMYTTGKEYFRVTFYNMYSEKLGGWKAVNLKHFLKWFCGSHSGIVKSLYSFARSSSTDSTHIKGGFTNV